MRRLLAVFALALLCAAAHAQSILPNMNYNGQLNAACTNANTSCPNAVFVTGLGSAGTSGQFGAGAALDIPVANYSAATIYISGTYAGSTINFEDSDPTGMNYFQEVCARTDINLLEVSEILPSNQVRAWQCPVWAATRFRVRQSAYASGNVNVWITLTTAAIDPSLVVAASIANIAGASDPCQDVSAIKQTAFTAILTTSATTALVAVSGTTNVYVCGAVIDSASTTSSNTVFFEQGSGAACVTSPTQLTATLTFPIAISVPSVWSSGGTIFKTTAGGNGICLVTTVGATPSVSVTLTYVQQ